MKLFPYESYYLISQLGLEDAIRIIQNEVESKKPVMSRYFSKEIERSYEGIVFEDGFRINRIIKYYNSFQPEIIGKLFRESGKTVVHITMKMDILVTIFTIIIGALLITSLIAVSLMALNGRFNSVILGVAGFFLLLYLFSLLPFKSESAESKRFFAKVFKAEEFSNTKTAQ
jgi:hypothetical protein